MTYRIGVAGVPGKTSTEALGKAFRQRGTATLVFDLGDARLDLDRGEAICHGWNLGDLDALVVKKLGDSIDPRVPQRVNLLHAVENQGVRVFSRPGAVEAVNDRYRMTMRLRQAGVPMPPTVVTDSLEEAAATIEEWGAAVLKPVFTSKGRGMHLLRCGEAHRLALRRWAGDHGAPFYLQQLVSHPGRDLGVGLLGGEPLGAYYRVGRAGEWRTTVQLGGHYEEAHPSAALTRLASQVAELFGLDFTIVDIVETPDGPMVYEASAFGGFGGLSQACGISAAERYADYVLKELRNR